MRNLINLLLSIVGLIIFILLVFMTFFYQPNYLTVPTFKDFSSGATLYNSGTEIWWYKNDINLYDSLYSNKKDVNISFSSGSWEVLVTPPWKYISSYYDIQREYTFIWEWYTILQEWIWEIFIDSESTPGKVFVFTLNTSATVTLEDSITNEKYTEIYLYPHMYIEFSPSRWKLLKWGDRLLVEIQTNLWYVSELNNNSDTISKRYLDHEDGFFSNTIQKIKSLQASAKNILDQFKNQDIDTILWYEIVNKYNSLFVNDEKKKVILKNKILTHVVSILNSQRIDEELINNTKWDLQLLKEYSDIEYTDMMSFLSHLIYLNNIEIQIDTSVSKFMFSSLLYDDLVIEKEDFLLLWYSIFSTYDVSWFFNIHFFDHFLSTFETFKTIDNTSEVIWSSEYQYFSYFLERNISHLINSNSSQVDLESINKILERNINLWIKSYDGSKIWRISGLFVYSWLLKELDIFLRNKFFLANRDSIWLLQINVEESYNVAQMTRLSKMVSDIFIIYDRNEKFLDSQNLRDISIRKDFDISRKKLEEYFSALESYDLYVSKYDELRQEIINIDTINNTQWPSNNLSKESIQKYLSRFRGLDIGKASVSIVDDRYYVVDNVVISGKMFSFDIYPWDDYKLTNIVIDNVEQYVQYKLWLLDSTTSAWENGIEDDFSYFFINTFFRNEPDIDIEEFEVKELLETEDKAEIVFKRDKLLWDSGEFADILDTIAIAYNDIRLERKSTNYDIFITNANLQLWWTQLSFAAQYNLTQIDHHFTNINISSIDSPSGAKFQLKISWKVHIQDIENMLQNLGSIISSIWKIGFQLDNAWYFYEKMYVTYSSFNQKTSIKVDLNGETYTIWLANEEITSLYTWTTKLIESPISIQNLEIHLP